MGDRRLTHRPTGRLLVAVLVTLLSLVAVHGSGSPDTPAGALATPHAAVGAAPHQTFTAVGRGDQESGPRRSAVRALTGQQLPPPAPQLLAVAVTPIAAPVVPAAAGSQVAADPSDPRNRDIPGRPSRAPPA